MQHNIRFYHICYCFSAPPTPYNFTAYNTSSTSITLNWARPQFPNGLLSYEVMYYPVGSSNGTTITNTSSTTLTITGLAFYTLYTFTVSAVTGGGMSNYSESVSQRTSEDGMSCIEYYVIIYMINLHTVTPPAPFPPLSVMAYNTSSTSIMVTWQPPQSTNGIIRGYQVNYTSSGGTWTTSVVDTGVINSIVLTNLSIYTTYTIFVRARTVTLGNSSTSIFVSTNEDGKFLFADIYRHI